MRTPPSHWRAIVAGFEASGLTVAEYCHRRRVSPASFFRWRRRLREGAPGHVAGPTFVEAVVRGPSGAASPVVEVRRWRVVVPPGFDPVSLGRLVATLERLDLDAEPAAAEVRP